jgi:ABC-type transport system involved in multi-copper enzyme maturation permease subunit
MRDRLAAIIHLTLIKLREPAFLLMALLAIGIGYWVSEMEVLSVQDDHEIFTYLLVAGDGYPVLAGFLIILATTLLLAVFIGATDIPRDIEGRIVTFILGKPVYRVEYLLGKYLGICLICVIFFALASGSAVLGHLVRSGGFYPFGLMLRQCLLLLVVFPFVAMTMMFSCFFSDLSAMIISAIYLVFALFVNTIPLLAEMLPDSIGIDAYLYMFYYWFPNYLYFLQNFRLLGLVFPAMVLYSASMSALFLMIAAVRINLRDMI